jgi:hypothetical protein
VIVGITETYPSLPKYILKYKTNKQKGKTCKHSEGDVTSACGSVVSNDSMGGRFFRTCGRWVGERWRDLLEKEQHKKGNE